MTTVTMTLEAYNESVRKFIVKNDEAYENALYNLCKYVDENKNVPLTRNFWEYVFFQKHKPITYFWGLAKLGQESHWEIHNVHDRILPELRVLVRHVNDTLSNGRMVKNYFPFLPWFPDKDKTVSVNVCWRSQLVFS